MRKFEDLQEAKEGSVKKRAVEQTHLDILRACKQRREAEVAWGQFEVRLAHFCLCQMDHLGTRSARFLKLHHPCSCVRLFV